MLETILQTHSHTLAAIMLLYTGPDQVMPLLSILGAIIGFILLWWQRLIQLFRRGWQAALKRSAKTARK